MNTGIQYAFDLGWKLYRTAEVVLPITALLILGVGLTGWGAKASLMSMVALLLGAVAAGLVVWLKHTDPETIGIT